MDAGLRINVMAGYSATPLGKKLGIKEGHRVGTYFAPDGFRSLLPDLPAGVVIGVAEELDGPLDVIVLFTRERTHLETAFARAKLRLDWNGGLWVSWPKQRSPLATELKEGDVRTVGLASGLVDNKICAVDDDWSGLRFMYRTEDRPGGRPKR